MYQNRILYEFSNKRNHVTIRIHMTQIVNSILVKKNGFKRIFKGYLSLKSIVYHF